MNARSITKALRAAGYQVTTSSLEARKDPTRLCWLVGGDFLNVAGPSMAELGSYEALKKDRTERTAAVASALAAAGFACYEPVELLNGRIWSGRLSGMYVTEA
jgi:hypothetical protein